MKSWIKGGLWGVGIGLILYFSTKINLFFPTKIFAKAPGNLSNDLVIITSGIFLYFLLGALIGFIVGKIRKKN